MKIYVVKVEYRHSDDTIAIFTDKEKAEKFYQQNRPSREHDAVEFYKGKMENGEVILHFPDKMEEK